MVPGTLVQYLAANLRDGPGRVPNNKLSERSTPLSKATSVSQSLQDQDKLGCG